MTNKVFTKRLISLFLCVVLMLSYVPLTAISATVASKSISEIVTDKSTSNGWEQMLGNGTDGNRYAGRVWLDRSVYKNGDVVMLNSDGIDGLSSFTVSLDDDEAFQVVFSALGSTMSSTETVTTTGAMDVVLILDTSTSMDDEDRDGVTRLERVINASNELLDDLLAIKNTRVAIVTYNRDSETVIALDNYDNGVNLVVTNYYNNGRNGAGVVTAYDDDNVKLGSDDGYTSGTNLQAGIDRGFGILANAENTKGRTPVAIVLTDGEANRANQASFYNNITEGDSASGRQLYLSTLLNAAYNKTRVEANYGVEQKVYGIGVDLTTATARLLMDPGDTTNRGSGFNSRNTTESVRQAYSDFLSWASGENVRIGKNNGGNWSFDHNYPKLNNTINDAKIAANINYVDTYYDVSGSDLSIAFEQITTELASGAFNPITSSSATTGGTGVDDTPLIYVDFIGQYMEIKEIEAITLFGSSYAVIKDANGNYTVEKATGTNPTTNEAWDTSKDIIITVTEQENGIQKLEIKINQEILPIIMKKVETQTVGGVTTSTITDYSYGPLRVYYTVGIDSDILLPNGEIDVTKILGYEHIDNETGTASFYGSQFGVMNPADSSGTVMKGDAHVGFRPSPENRYYYHQTNQGVFTEITDKETNKKVTISPNNSYGVEWDETKYDLTWMSYEDYKNAQGSDIVYTYVSFFRPTESITDAANAAEEVTYLVYTEWQYLKESIAFYDNNTGKYVNFDADNGYVVADEGKAIDVELVETVLNAYLEDNPDAELYAVLGVGSVRTSRFHNMTLNKDENNTGTAVESYAPEYLHGTAENEMHNGNDVVVWLGNNGRYTLEIDTGIALTKNVTEAIGNPDDTYALTVTVPAGVTAAPVVKDANGNDVTSAISTYRNNVLTVNLKAGETVYISGIPGGTTCLVDEMIDGDYYKVASSSTSTITVPKLSEVLDETNPKEQFVPAVVTNAPRKYGNLYITKQIDGNNHNVPANVMNSSFSVAVNVGTALAGKTFTVKTGSSESTKTVDNSGNITLSIIAGQPIQILRLPEGTRVTVTELTPAAYFKAPQYRTRNHTGEPADNDNVVVIPADYNATAIITNTYEPIPTSASLNIAGTKNFLAEQGYSHNGGSFTFQVEAWNGSAWTALTGKNAKVTYNASEIGNKSFAINDVLSGISYTTAGTYQYRIVEVKGSAENVTYDRTVYPFTVTVTDNGGQLTAALTSAPNSVLGSQYDVSFTNTFNTATIDIDIKKDVVNNSNEANTFSDIFQFSVIRTDAAWGNNSSENVSYINVRANGQSRFSATYSKAGTYYYEISEINAGEKGWTYSTAKYRVTVKVTADAMGDLIASIESIVKVDSTNSNETWTLSQDKSVAEVNFVNSYKPLSTSTSLVIEGTKDLFVDENASHDAVSFNFIVEELIGGVWTPVDGKTAKVEYLENDTQKTKTFSFGDVLAGINFAEVGVHYYRVVEVIGNVSNITYDRNGHQFSVVVTDEAGQLTAKVYDSNNNPLGTTYDVFFQNYFNKATVDINIVKNILNKSGVNKLFTEVFNFQIEVLTGSGDDDSTSEYSNSVSNSTGVVTLPVSANGQTRFTEVYTEAGIYTYKIKEIVETKTGWTYSTAKYVVTVEVTADNGELTAVVTKVEGTSTSANEGYTITNNKTAATVIFENTYEPLSTTVDIDVEGDKNLIVDNPSYTHEGVSFDFAVQEWDGTKWVTLEDKTASVTYNKGVSGKKDFKIENVLGDITYTKADTYYYRVVEVKGNAENITYDRTVYYFVVTVTDVNGQLKATVTDGNRNEITKVAANFTNTLNTATIDIDIQKDFVNNSGDNTMETEVFTFEVVETDSAWASIGTADKFYARANGQARFLNIYSEAGTYYYEIKEVNDNKAGWSYSTAKYRVTVEVTADSNGKLLAVITSIDKVGSSKTVEKATIATDKTEATVIFENTYTPSEISVNLDGKVKKELTGKTLLSGMFEFYVYNNEDRTTALFKGTNDLNGNVNFVDFEDVLFFDKVGKYEYDIVEYIPEGAVLDAQTGKYVLNGMSYDATIFDLVVEITNNKETGKLEANFYFEDSLTTEVTFHNSYKASEIDYTIGGRKLLHGRAPRAGEFSFELYLGDQLIDTVTNKADGTFAFSAYTYFAEGEYTFTVKEKAGNVPGVTYTGASNPITVKVTVTDTNGVLSAAADVENAEIVFENTYSAKPAKVVFDGTKTFVGGTLKENDFSFKLYKTDYSFNVMNANAELLATVKNTGAKFDEFTFESLLDKAGTYFFVVVEDSSDKLENVVYDETQHRYIVNVSDIGDGQLRVVVTNAVTGVRTQSAKEINVELGFTNATFSEIAEKEVYLEGSTTTHIDGKEVKSGDVLTYFLTYNNFTGKDVAVDIMDVIPNHTEYVEGSASHGGTYAGGHINWVLNVKKGESVTVTFDVKVTETDAIVANTATIRDGINTYKTNEVVNHTIENEMTKDVFSPSDVTISIDGNKVYEGDELVYKVTFTNASKNLANITITDKIPENTTYVDGSADNGGVFKDGTLTWKLELSAWEKVTVAFKVKVNSDIGAKTITNKATATDGSNNYETNVVTNYTVEDEFKKEVALADKPEVSIDGKKVYAGDILVYTITYKNSANESAAITITDNIPEYTTYVDGSADNDGVYNEGTITWTLNVEAEKTATVTFKVKVNDVGNITIKNTADLMESKNSYKTNEVTNYTVEDEVEKSVFDAANPTVNIDGKPVLFGDTLIYAISYKNTSNEKATITITDTVPEYTTYVDGSADNSGVYNEGTITWTLDVEAGQTATVTFKVKVDNVVKATIINEATIVEGNNKYITNVVSNPTENPVLPDTGDNSNLWLWFALLFISGTVFLGNSLKVKRRRII